MTSANIKDAVNGVLPDGILKGPNLNPEKSLQYIQKFLQQELPNSDVGGVKGGLKWQFLLEKHSFTKRSKRKPKKTFLTRAQRKELNLLKLPKEGWSFKELGAMRNMWKEYMRENFDLIKRAPSCTDVEWSSFSVVAAKSELVGADIRVVKSKVPSLIGMSGTVVLETKSTFQIVTPESKLKTLIKESSVFEFGMDNLRFTVYGRHIATRPNERSVKKIKAQMMPDL